MEKYPYFFPQTYASPDSHTSRSRRISRETKDDQYETAGMKVTHQGELLHAIEESISIHELSLQTFSVREGQKNASNHVIHTFNVQQREHDYESVSIPVDLAVGETIIGVPYIGENNSIGLSLRKGTVDGEYIKSVYYDPVKQTFLDETAEERLKHLHLQMEDVIQQLAQGQVSPISKQVLLEKLQIIAPAMSTEDQIALINGTIAKKWEQNPWLAIVTKTYLGIISAENELSEKVMPIISKNLPEEVTKEKSVYDNYQELSEQTLLRITHYVKTSGFKTLPGKEHIPYEARFAAFAKRTARNLWFDRVREEQAEKNKQQKLKEGIIKGPQTMELPPIHSLTTLIPNWETIAEKLLIGRKKELQVLQLYIKNFSHQEIAQQLGITTINVASHLYLARKILEEKFMTPYGLKTIKGFAKEIHKKTYSSLKHALQDSRIALHGNKVEHLEFLGKKYVLRKWIQAYENLYVPVLNEELLNKKFLINKELPPEIIHVLNKYRYELWHPENILRKQTHGVWCIRKSDLQKFLEEKKLGHLMQMLHERDTTADIQIFPDKEKTDNTL